MNISMAIRCLCLLLLLLVVSSQEYEEDLMPESADWVDPGDMLNYDHSTKTMKTTKKKVASATVEKEGKKLLPEMECKYDRKDEQKAKEQADHCLQEFNAYQKVCEREKQELPITDLYFRQYVANFLKRLPLRPSSIEQLYQVELVLSGHDWSKLEEFSTGKSGQVQDAHQILSTMVKRTAVISHFSEDTWWQILETLLGGQTNVVIMVMCMALIQCLAVLMILARYCPRISIPRFLFTLFVSLFLISVPWNWWHLYKITVAERSATALNDVPRECQPEKMSTAETLLSGVKSLFTFSSNPCNKYYEQMLVDPMWEVSPTKAFAVTIIKFFVEPAEYVGGAINKLIRSTVQDMPIQWALPAFLLLAVLVILMLLMMCGYRIWMPLIQIEPSHRPTYPAVESNRVQELTFEQQRLKHQLEETCRKLEQREHEASLMRIEAAPPPVTTAVAPPPIPPIVPEKTESLPSTEQAVPRVMEVASSSKHSEVKTEVFQNPEVVKVCGEPVTSRVETEAEANCPEDTMSFAEANPKLVESIDILGQSCSIESIAGISETASPTYGPGVGFILPDDMGLRLSRPLTEALEASTESFVDVSLTAVDDQRTPTIEHGSADRHFDEEFDDIEILSAEHGT